MRFDRCGLTFDYPDSWSVDVEDPEGRLAAVSVHAPEGGFWSVSGHAPGGEASSLAEAVVETMRGDYRELDSEAASDLVAGHRLEGFDMNFYCLDLTSTAQVRTLTTPRAIYLLFCQAEDRDWDRIDRVFAAMTASFVAGVADGPAGADTA